jgi:hypothetical protein
MRAIASVRGRPNTAIPLIVLVAGVLTLPFLTKPPASAQVEVDEALPLELQYIPADAAFFVHADASKIWNSEIFRSIRKADSKTFDVMIAQAKSEFGLSPENVKSVGLFIPKITNPGDLGSVGVLITFKDDYDKEKLQKGVVSLVPKELKPKVVPVNDRSVLVLINLGDEYAKPQPADKTGPLTAIIKQAATGQHTLVSGVTLASFPEEIRGDDLPAQIRAFQPLFRAQSVTATLDLGKSIDLDIRVKTATAGQAIDCEKSLGALLALIQDELSEGLKEFDVMKDPTVKEIVALMKAGMESAKGAKFVTLGNESRLTASMPVNLPFAEAYLIAKKRAESIGAVTMSANNLKQIGLAMHNYYSAEGQFPPAAVCDKTGKPLLSWRVLILPYIDQEDLFKQFKLDEAWDSEHNKKLLPKMPKAYAVPGKTQPGDTTAHYRVFVGNGAGFDWIMGGKIENITDGTSNTLMCATAEKAVPWTKPDELEFDPDQDMTKLIGLSVNGRWQAVFFDGSVRNSSNRPDKKTLHAIITRAGGEVIGPDFDR